MGLLEPFALLLLPALAAVIVLYLLRFRRPVAPVPSVALWERTLRDREANTLWQRLRVSLLLALQLLLLLLLIIAVARPWTLGSGQRVRHSVIVVDVSASMSANIVEEGESRIESARREAAKIVDDMDSGGTATLIAAGAEPNVIVPATSDKARLRAAIGTLVAEPVSGDMVAALRLAATITEGRSDAGIWVISDGAFPRSADSTQLTGQKLEFIGVGAGEEATSANQGITAMSLTGQDGTAQSLFLQIANSSPLTVTRRIEINVDDAPWEARTLELGAGQTLELEIDDVPAEGRVFHARLSATDLLALDDEAWVVSRASGPMSALLVSEGNRFLEVALTLLPGVSLYRVPPAKFDPAATLEGKPFDVTVIDASVPVTTFASLPTGNFLVFSPPVSLPGITVTGVITNPLPIAPSLDAQQTESQNTYRLDLAGLTSTRIAQAANLQPASDATVLLASDKGPLIVVNEQGGRRIASVAFALGDSDLPLQSAFPIMMRDLVRILRPDASLGLAAAVEPLASVILRPSSAEVTDILIEDPSGKEWTVRAESAGVTFAQTSLPGTYYVTHYALDKVVWQGAFAVNLFAREESILPPNANALPRLVAASEFRPSAPTTESARLELWWTFAALALLLLLGEWAYANRIAIRRAITEARARRVREI